MKLVTNNLFNGYQLDETAINMPIVINNKPIGIISGFSGGDSFEDKDGLPLFVELNIWDCGWSVLKDEEDNIVGIVYDYPYDKYDMEWEED